MSAYDPRRFTWVYDETAENFVKVLDTETGLRADTGSGLRRNACDKLSSHVLPNSIFWEVLPQDIRSMSLILLVGAAGFEPTTPSPPD